MPSWNWDEEASGSGVVHQSTANTDHTNASILKQGYDYANFSEVTPNPVACWPLHEDSGSTAYDLAGTNDGAYNGPTLGQTGILGTTAPSFDGTDDNISANTVSVGAGPFTALIWFNADSTSGDHHIIRNVDSNESGFTSSIRSGTLGIEVENTGSRTVQSTSFSDTTSWHQLAFDSDANAYLDASPFSGGEQVGDTNDTGLRLGSRGANDFNFDGRLSDARVYDTTLTQSQIQTLYDVVNTTGEWVGNGKLL